MVVIVVVVTMTVIIGRVAVSTIPVSMRLFDEPNSPRNRDTEQQQRGERGPIVRVKRHFGEQVGQRDAEENARCKSECTANHECLLADKIVDSQHKANRSQRAHHRKASIGDHGILGVPASRFHQRRDRQSVERFV